MDQFGVRRKFLRKKEGRVVIDKYISLDAHQEGLQVLGSVRPTPFDATQNKFKGEQDAQFIPMDIAEVHQDVIQETRKVPMGMPPSRLGKIAKRRTRIDKTQQAITEQILNSTLTL